MSQVEPFLYPRGVIVHICDRCVLFTIVTAVLEAKSVVSQRLIDKDNGGGTLLILADEVGSDTFR